MPQLLARPGLPSVYAGSARTHSRQTRSSERCPSGTESPSIPRLLIAPVTGLAASKRGSARGRQVQRSRPRLNWLSDVGLSVTQELVLKPASGSLHRFGYGPALKHNRIEPVLSLADEYLAFGVNEGLCLVGMPSSRSGACQGVSKPGRRRHVHLRLHRRASRLPRGTSRALVWGVVPLDLTDRVDHVTMSCSIRRAGVVLKFLVSRAEP